MVKFHLFTQGHHVPDERWLKELYYRMRLTSLWSKVFWDCPEWTWFSFFNFICHETWCYLGINDDNLVGAVWFNQFSEESCFVHICSLKGYKSSKWEGQIGNLLQNVLDKSDNPCYKIKAKTPRKGMARLYKHMGFKLCTTEKNFYILEKGKD